MREIRKYFFLFSFIFCHYLVNSLTAQENKYFFYRPLNYGSEAMFNPLTVIFNGGFDVLQSYYSSTRINDISWHNGATSIWQSVTAPAYYINQYGWNRFFRQEVFSTSLNIEKAQWVPNYALHLVGGGMEYRKLSEWYDYHGYPTPFIFGAITSMGYHFLNELVENGPNIHPNIDAIADFCIFDPLGIILFSFDAVADYFTQFGLNDWSPQPSFSFKPLSIRNFGHSFVLRYPLTSSKQTNAFCLLGKSSLFGLSIKTDNEHAISFGGGIIQTSVYEVDKTNGIGTNSIKIGASCGIFYDRNNSLLASLLLSDYLSETVRLNIYPGIILQSVFSPGFFITFGERGTFTTGVTMQYSPFGLGVHTPR